VAASLLTFHLLLGSRPKSKEPGKTEVKTPLTRLLNRRLNLAGPCDKPVAWCAFRDEIRM
jgi:hypothetical protein